MNQVFLAPSYSGLSRVSTSHGMDPRHKAEDDECNMVKI